MFKNSIAHSKQKSFFRNISFLLHCSHPLIAELKGFSFFNDTGDMGNFTVISGYAENGFLMETVFIHLINNILNQIHWICMTNQAKI